jgi:hypothetical protein
MTRKRIGWSAAAAVSIVFVGVAISALYSPQPHDVHTAGATAITNARVAQADHPTYGYLQLSPSMSLDDLRCQAWRAERTPQCPDAAALEQRYWPGVRQTTNTLYVALPPSCPGYTSGGFNFEYFKSSRTLMLHCYRAAPWLVFSTMHMPGVQALPPAGLVLVPTDAFGAGNLNVVEEDRVEHLLGDDSTQAVLGVVAVS